MTWTRSILLSALLTGFVACGDTSGPPEEAFQLRIRVVDTDGNPVPGIVVNGFNRIPRCAIPDPGIVCDGPVTRKARPATMIHLDVVDSSTVTLAVRDLNGRLVRSLVDAQLRPGRYTVFWDGFVDAEHRAPDGVYRFEAVATRAAVELYRDEFLAYLFTAVDINLGPPYGTTDASGIVETTDILRFPGVHTNALTLHGTDPFGITTCDFQFSEFLTVLLYDPSTQRGLAACDAIRMTRNSNAVTVVWDPSAARIVADVVRPQSDRGADAGVLRRIETPDPPVPPVDPAWDLWVAPNPFN